jgi:hypothetical protein
MLMQIAGIAAILVARPLPALGLLNRILLTTLPLLRRAA